MKYINNNKRLKLLSLCFFLFQLSHAQVSNYEKIEKTGHHNFNYLNKTGVKKIKKDKDIFVVYSDKSNNQAYFDPYQQKKAKKQKLLTPYFVIDEKNEAYELVAADSSQIGKPKGIFSFFMNKKNHFKDAKNVTYIGWIPKENILTYNHSFLSPINNKPLKYKIGTHSLEKLLEYNKFVKSDSIILFKDPLLKQAGSKKIILNQTIYPYKYSRTGKAVLISNKPIIKDTINQLFGWVPSDMISSVGQGKSYKINNSVLTITQEECDTLKLSANDVYSNFIYNVKPLNYIQKDSITQINIPFYVWDHRNNKLINVKGNDVLISEVNRFEKESNTINFHFIFNNSDKKGIKPLINSLQNVWLFLSNNKGLKYSFSSIYQGNDYSYILPKTDSFEKWIDFIQKVIEGGKGLKKYRNLDLTEAISSSLSDSSHHDKNFETNFFIITGINSPYKLYEQTHILKQMTIKSSIVLFVQLENQPEESYQNYLLYNKEALARLSYYYNSFIKNYIVNSNLLINKNTLKNIPTEKDNIYIYDAPKNSLYNGGVIFPQIDQNIQASSVNIAIDSILQNKIITNKELLTSLKEYKDKLGVIRSKPSLAIKCFFKSETLDTNKIDKSSLNEVLYKVAELDNTSVQPFKKGYQLNKDEIVELIDNYRALLPNFVEVNKESRKVLKKLYKKQIREINKAFARKVIRKRNNLGMLFFYKTGIPVNDKRFELFTTCKLKIKSTEENNFKEFYTELLEKVEVLEKLFLDNEFIKINDNTYFIPEELLL